MDSQIIDRLAAKQLPTLACDELLNIGCGDHFHDAWTNLDLFAQDDAITEHDVTKGLPYADNSFDAIYHSHVLEHLGPEQGRGCLAECFRVLKPGGVLRVVVPDLEQIAQLYLEMHHCAWNGDADARTNYDWMKLELLDQMVRQRPGGRMGQYMSNPNIPNSDFVVSRIGNEFQNCLRSDSKSQSEASENSFGGRIGKAVQKFRSKMARRFVRWTLGREAEAALQEGLLRQQGEVHRWMYDRFSLREVCERVGFKDFTVLTAWNSQIQGFDRFELDVVGDFVRKPDSLFCECRKSDE